MLAVLKLIMTSLKLRNSLFSWLLFFCVLLYSICHIAVKIKSIIVVTMEWQQIFTSERKRKEERTKKHGKKPPSFRRLKSIRHFSNWIACDLFELNFCCFFFACGLNVFLFWFYLNYCTLMRCISFHSILFSFN